MGRQDGVDDGEQSTSHVTPEGRAGGERSRMQSAAVHGSVWTLISTVVSLPLNFVVNIIVVRFLGAEQFGLLATLGAAFAIGTTVVNLGVNDATVQWGAADDAAGRRRALLELARRSSGFHLFVQTPLAVVLVCYLLRGESVMVAVIGSVGVALTLVTSTSVVVQIATNRTARNAQVVLVANVALQGAVVVTAVVDSHGSSVWAARLVFLSLPGLVVMFTQPSDLRQAMLHPRLPVGWPLGFPRFATKAVALGVLSALVLSRSEIFILQHYGFTAAAGLFALAFGLSAQITAVIDALLLPLLPAAAGLIEVDRAAATRGFVRALRILSAGTSVVLAVLMPPVTLMFTAIYGTDFAPAAAMFIPLTVASCLTSANAPTTAFLSGARRLGVLALVSAGALVVDVVVALALIPTMGAWGAVIGNSAGQVVAVGGALSVLARVLAAPVTTLLLASSALVRGTVVGVVVSTAGLTVGALAPAPVLAGGGLLAGLLALVVVNRVGPSSLGHSELDILIATVPRRMRHVVRAAIELAGFARRVRAVG